MWMEHRFSNKNLPNYNADMPWHVIIPTFISFHIDETETIHWLTSGRHFEKCNALNSRSKYFFFLWTKLIFCSLKKVTWFWIPHAWLQQDFYNRRFPDIGAAGYEIYEKLAGWARMAVKMLSLIGDLLSACVSSRASAHSAALKSVTIKIAGPQTVLPNTFFFPLLIKQYFLKQTKHACKGMRGTRSCCQIKSSL